MMRAYGAKGADTVDNKDVQRAGGGRSPSRRAVYVSGANVFLADRVPMASSSIARVGYSCVGCGFSLFGARMSGQWSAFFRSGWGLRRGPSDFLAQWLLRFSFVGLHDWSARMWVSCLLPCFSW